MRKGRVIYYSVSLRRTFSFHGESIHESFLLIVFFLFRFFFFFFFHFTGSPFRPRLPPVSHKAKSGRQLPQTCPADQISASSHFARDGAAHDFADEPTTSSASRETRMGKKKMRRKKTRDGDGSLRLFPRSSSFFFFPLRLSFLFVSLSGNSALIASNFAEDEEKGEEADNERGGKERKLSVPSCMQASHHRERRGAGLMGTLPKSSKSDAVGHRRGEEKQKSG